MSTIQNIPAQAAPDAPVRVQAHHAVTKRLGNWTTANHFQVRAHHGLAVVDLRSPRLPAGDLYLDVELDHATLKLLVADDAVVDDWDLRRSGRARVSDASGRSGPAGPSGPGQPGGRRIVVAGWLRQGTIRVHRGGMAILTAMWSRAYVDDLRRAHKQGGMPTVADPAHTS